MNDELERVISSKIKETPDLDPPEWLADSVIRRIAPEEAPQSEGLLRRFIKRRTVSFSPPALALAAALAVLAFTAGFLAGDHNHHALYGKDISIAFTAAEKNAEASFLMGRSLLAAGLHKEAARYFLHAVEMEPLQTEFRIWLGKAYAASGRPDDELRQYKLAAAVDTYSTAALHELADGYMRAGQYKEAAAEYARILVLRPGDPKALYKRAAALRLLGHADEAGMLLKRIIAQEPSGPLAMDAAAFLNRMGDYEYRRTVIGKRRIILKSPRFSGGRLTDSSLQNLTRIAGLLVHDSDTVLQVVAYADNDPKAAKNRALAVKNAILRARPEISARRIQTSWFGSAEKLDDGGVVHDSIRIFGVSNKDIEKKQGVRT